MSLTEIILVRQWLVHIADSLSANKSRQVYDKINEMNNILWETMFHESSPWASAKKYQEKKNDS